MVSVVLSYYSGDTMVSVVLSYYSGGTISSVVITPRVAHASRLDQFEAP